MLRKNTVYVRTRPIPNLTAYSTGEGKVKESVFKLLHINPTTTTSICRLTHKTSAVSSRCVALLILIVTISKVLKLISPSKFI